MAQKFKQSLFTMISLAAFAGAAEAHVGHGSTVGFTSGLTHPLSGFDHILAMLAVGLIAARLGGKALWAVPAAFVGMMVVGGALGMNGFELPYVELGIIASVIALGAAATLNFRSPLWAATGLAGFFALFHGHAHGAEMPLADSGVTYAMGFVVATALLHGLGLALGIAMNRVAKAGAQPLQG